MAKRLFSILVCLCLFISMTLGIFADDEDFGDFDTSKEVGDFAEDEYDDYEEVHSINEKKEVGNFTVEKEVIVEDVISNEYKEAVDFLKSINIIPSSLVGNLEAFVSRANFVLYAANMLKIEPGNAETVFADVPVSHGASGAIEAFYQLGYISRQENFRPNDEISLQEAMKILVACVGHNVIAESRGEYPVGHLQIARELNIISRMSRYDFSGNISGFQASQLIFNTMQADLLTQTGYGNLGNYSKENGVNILTKYFDIYYIDGIIQSNGVTALTSSNTSKKIMSIGGIEIEIAENDVRELLGLNARVFYSKKNDACVFLIAHFARKNDVVSFFGKDYDLGYISDRNFIRYIESGKEQRLNLDKTFKLIYNGKAEGDYEAFLADIEHAHLKLIDNNRDGLYDVVVVDRFTDMIVSTVNQNEEIIYDIYGENNLKIYDYDMVYIRNKVGESIKLTQIKKRDVLSFAVSNDGKYIDIVVCSESIIGKITEKDSDGIFIIEISETGTVVNCYSPMMNLKVGDNGIFYLNALGYIVDFVKSISEEKVFGLLIAVAPPKGIAQAVEIKMLTAYDEIKVFETAPRVEIDGNNYRGIELVYKAVEEKIKEVVIYSLNQDGLINYLDFAQTTTPVFNEGAADGGLYLYKKNELTLYKSALGTFANRFLVDDNTVIFGVDSNMKDMGADESEIYYATRRGVFVNDVSYEVAAYTVEQDPCFADVVLYSGDRKRKTLAPAVIYEVNRSLDNEGNHAYRAFGVSPSGDIEIIMSEECMINYDVVAGDVITYQENGAGVVYNVLKHYDYRTKEISSPGASFNSSHRLYIMHPFSVFNQSIKFVEEKDSNKLKIDINNEDLMQCLIATQNIYRIIQRNGKVDLESVSLDSIVSYRNNPSEYSKLVSYTSYGNVRLLLIYDD